MDRREFMKNIGRTALGAAFALSGADILAQEVAKEKSARSFRLWASSDCHVGTDMRVKQRESLADAIRQAEENFDWDIGVHLGDFSGNQGAPKDGEGQEVVRQFGALTKHSREDIYCIAGNHDATFPDEEPQWWFKKWLDPEGRNTEFSGVDASKRRYPITGNWERYSFRAGNILFLMMSDYNHVGPPVGRGERGGFPAGAVSEETFAWWKKMVSENPDCIIISAHHHMLKETTSRSGEFEGFSEGYNGKKFHGRYEEGGPKGASYLYFLGDKPDAQAFEGYLAEHPGATDIWLGGHTHTIPDDNYNGRTLIEKKWGTNFINVAHLTRYHGLTCIAPKSRLLTFTEGSDKVKVQCYLHTSEYAPQGWYDKAEKIITVGKPFTMT